MARELAIVLNNGSLNSAIASTLAAQKFRVIFLHGEGGSVTPRAKAAYEAQVAHFKPYREHRMELLRIAPNAPLISATTDPRATVSLAPRLIELLPLMAMSLRYAEHYHAVALYTGLRLGAEGNDLARATEFFQIWRELAQTPCGLADFEVENPLLELDAWQVVDLGVQVSAPLDRGWSCTEDGADPCWACRGCASREAAFLQAAKADPLRIARKV